MIPRPSTPAALPYRTLRRLDHVPKLVQGPEGVLAGTVGVVGGEERHRTVAPVVDKAWQTGLGVTLEDREQLHRGDPRSCKEGILAMTPA